MMNGSSSVPCPRCRKHVGFVPGTGDLIEHPGQPKRVRKKVEWEQVCAASGIAVARVLAGGELALRDSSEVLNDIDRKLGLPGNRKKKRGGSVGSSNSVRTVSGGLPGLGKRR